jgi:elongator complex protein 5
MSLSPRPANLYAPSAPKSSVISHYLLQRHLPFHKVSSFFPSLSISLHEAKVTKETLLIIDTLNTLSTNPSTSFHLSPFLSSLLISPSISLLSTYHLDIPLPSPSHPSNQYTPDALTTLTYLATAILRTATLSHTLARKRARDRSLQEPEFGLREGREGVIVGLKGEKVDGMVVEMEIRRKSGRGVVETFVLCPPAPSSGPVKSPELSSVMLLDEHPLYASTPSELGSTEGQGGDEEVETTFNLGLTEKQKRDREGVVLPYFDAQKEGGALGAGEGGRILYEMGAEDREDFDDEEDEI